jgi:RNA polymerase sigma-70 factor (ECF subfamily)
MGELIGLIEGDLRIFIFARVNPTDAKDVFQVVLTEIILNLCKCKGKTFRQFLAWCYQIARNKVADHYRRNRLDPFPMDELWELVEASKTYLPLTAADEIDLKYALELLEMSHPECREILWDHYILDRDIAEIAEELQLKYDAARMRINRCLETARKYLD